MPESATFQTLWHEVTIVGAGAGIAEWLAAIVSPTWPMPTELSSRYRLECAGGGCTVWQGADVLVVAPDVDTAWRVLTERIGARCFEVAAHRGWTPVRGSVLTGVHGHVCLVGSLPDRIAASVRLAAAGAALASHDGWITRDGEVLPVPLAGVREVQGLAAARPAEVVLRLPEESGRGGTAEALAALVSAADRSVRSPVQVVRDLSALLRRVGHGVPEYHAQLGGEWYFS